MSMNRITITAGTGEDRHGRAIPADVLPAKLERIRAYLAQEYGGFTELETTGGWADDTGRLVLETGRRFIIASADPFWDGREAADYVRRALNQASVMLERDARADVQFVDAGREAAAA